MDVGNHYSEAETNFLSELRQYFPPDTPESDIIAMYQNPALFQQYMKEIETYYADAEANYSVYNECLLPVLQQSFESVWLLLVFCLILRLLSVMKIPQPILHIASFVFGCLSLWKFYSELMIYVLIPMSLVIILNQTKRLHGLWIAALTGMYMLSCEFTILSSVDWTKIKGSVMVVSMKIISLAFDQESETMTQISILECFGYVFNPASVIFGPFITFKNYQQFLHNKKLSFGWIFGCSKVLLISIICLIWSSCGTTYYLPKLSGYIPTLESNRWWKAYQEAQQFRFSHFFVCYLSEGCCLLLGIGTFVTKPENFNKEKSKKNENEEKSEEKKANISWRCAVANLSMVELPRSLVDVVTNWNLPMHYWLKQYIFKSTRQFGVFPAILITYFASSMLHSLNFQLSAVLLSIGVFAYVESVFRQSISSLLNACLEARPCRNDCVHKFKKGNFWVTAGNLMFGLFAVWNLAYLGCLFDSSDEEVKGYSMKHALKKWGQYNYINHVVMLCILLLNFLFKKLRS